MHRLLKIDELLRSQHSYLSQDDDCYYFMEYTSGAGYSYSSANSLILNLKKSPETRGEPQWKYKTRAIKTISEMFSDSLVDFIDFPKTIIVPVPPSKRKDHEHYDDRMVQVLKRFCSDKVHSDLRELLSSRENIEPSHGTNNRPSPATIAENLLLDQSLCKPVRKKILLVDDVLTSGAHFIACKNVLKVQFPNTEITGLFVARRVFDAGLDFL